MKISVPGITLLLIIATIILTLVSLLFSEFSSYPILPNPKMRYPWAPMFSKIGQDLAQIMYFPKVGKLFSDRLYFYDVLCISLVVLVIVLETTRLFKKSKTFLQNYFITFL